MKKLILCIAAPLIFFSCSSSNVGSDVNYDTHRLALSESIETVYDKALKSASKMKWKITDLDEEAYHIEAKTPFEEGRWSENVSVSMDQAGDSTIVVLKSNMGKKSNKEYLAEYLKSIEEDQ